MSWTILIILGKKKIDLNITLHIENKGFSQFAIKTES